MIILSSLRKEEIVKQALSAGKREACGILAGKERKIEKIYPITNTSEFPETCYFMDTKEQLKVMKEIRKKGLEMTGIYHTHPASEAYPSAKDVELAFYPEAAYVIISLKDPMRPELRAFKIAGGKITEEEIIIE